MTNDAGRFSEITVHFAWFGVFAIRVWADCGTHDNTTVLRDMIEEWCNQRWGRGQHNPGFVNQQERADLTRLGEVAASLMHDLDLEAVEVMDVKAGVGAKEYQRRTT